MKVTLTFKMKTLEYASIALLFIVLFTISIVSKQDFL